jgi:hypothetical protein
MAIQGQDQECCDRPLFTNIQLPSPTASDITAFLCDVLAASRSENPDPVIRPAVPFNESVVWHSLTGQVDVGDPRISNGFIFRQMYDTFIKRAELQIEVLQAGGCQIIDNCICGTDDIPIVKLERTCTDEEAKELLKPITFNEIETFVTDLWNKKIKETANDFVDYLRKNYISKGWEAHLYQYKEVPVFYVELRDPTKLLPNGKTNPSKYKFYRYYSDSKQYVSEGLGVSIKYKTSFLSDASLDDWQNENSRLAMQNLMNSLAAPIWPQKSIFSSKVSF